MSSIGAIFSTAASALRASQAGVAVAGHNIANASTAGYSRQHLDQAAAPGVRTPEGRLGAGVAILGVDRSRDLFLDTGFRNEAARSHGYRSHGELLQRLEAVMAEPGGDGISAALDRFLSAWSGLAASPESPAARGSLRQEAEALVQRLNDVAAGVDRLRQEATDRLDQEVAHIRNLTRDLAALNREIVATEVDGSAAPDLRDLRDRALDALAELIPIEVIQQPSGAVDVHLAGIRLVDGPSTPPIGLAWDGGGFRLQIGGTTVPLSRADGRVGAGLEALNHDIPQLQVGLNTLADALVVAVNDLHRGGTNPLGQEGIDFFHVPVDGNGDPLPVTAASIRLSDAVRASALAIAAGRGSDPGGVGNTYQSGRNDVAWSMAALRDAPVASGMSLHERYGSIVSELAHRTHQSRQGAEVYGTLALQAEYRRAEVSGVSMDEEMARLIQFQASYAAATRVLSAADEMLQTLLGI